MGLAPEAWEARDRVVSPRLLREFEKVVLERAEDRLEKPVQLFLRRLSVLRRPFDRRALEALSPDENDLAQARDELIARYMMEFRSNFYEIHSVLRDTVRLRMTGAERRRAHLVAGRYYAAPFRARQLVGDPEKLGARFIEARYQFTMAESERGLAEISQRFEAHFRTQFQPTSQFLRTLKREMSASHCYQRCSRPAARKDSNIIWQDASSLETSPVTLSALFLTFGERQVLRHPHQLGPSESK